MSFSQGFSAVQDKDMLFYILAKENDQKSCNHKIFDLFFWYSNYFTLKQFLKTTTTKDISKFRNLLKSIKWNQVCCLSLWFYYEFFFFLCVLCLIDWFVVVVVVIIFVNNAKVLITWNAFWRYFCDEFWGKYTVKN